MGKLAKKAEKPSKDSKKAASKVPRSSKDILAEAKDIKPATTVKDTKKTKKVEATKTAPKGKGKVSSSEESSESSSEDEKPKVAQVKAAPVKATSAKMAASSSSSESDSSDFESEEEKPKPKATQSKVSTPKKAAIRSSESDSDSESSEEEEAKPVVKSKKAAPKAVEKKKVVEKKPVSESSDSSDSDSDEEAPKKATDSSDSSEDEETTEVKKSTGSSDSSDSSSSSDSSEDEDGDVKMAEVKVNGANKRKADDEVEPTAKKVKLANGDAAPAEETKAIFVGQLSWGIDNDRLAQEFAECGEVESATVQTDRNTGRSRGFGYVHFSTTEAVEKALLMNGQEIDGRAIKVDRSAPRDASKDRAKRAEAFGDTSSPPSSTLFVGNLSFGATEDAVWSLFNDYGVKSVRLPTDRETGRPKGFGYVEFEDLDGAKKAFEALSGADFEGRNIRLDYSQPRDPSGGGGFGGGRGGGRGGFGGDRGGRGGFGGDRGGRGRGGFGGGRGRGGFGDRGGRGGGRGGPPKAKTGGIAAFEGKKTTF